MTRKTKDTIYNSINTVKYEKIKKEMFFCVRNNTYTETLKINI